MPRSAEFGRLCVYTVLTGGYEEIVEQPMATASGVPFLCFTDNRDLVSSTWQFRAFEPPLPADPARSSREPKIRPHRHLAEFDTSLYIDNSVLLTASPREIVATLLPDDAVMGLIAHSDRHRLADEFDAVTEYRFDSRDRVGEQRAHYLSYDASSLELPVWWGAVLARRHHDPAVVHAMELWWMHVLRYSRRDQLSLPVVLTRSGLPVAVMPADNRAGPFHRWPVAPHRDRARGGAPWTESEDALTLARQNLESAHAEIDHVRAEVAELRQMVRTVSAERDRAIEAREAADRRTDAAERRLRQLMASHSWRITEPVRRVSRRLKRPGR